MRDRAVVEGKSLVRGGRKVRVRGVTYGPFELGADGQPFPGPQRVSEDFARMHAAGINAIRTYHVPPEWLLELADEHTIFILVDVPWPKHTCFLDGKAARSDARALVRQAAMRCRDHASVLAYSIGNEIRPDVVRWHGVRRVERFLAELKDIAKQADPHGLVTYASYPSTEYLDSSLFDFATFNVYLHDREAFRRYLFRLQNLVGDRPLVLGELGMDTFRHGELEQAAFLQGHLEEATLMGLAGAFIFSWTDDWHTGGHPIEDWAFGITHADRSPKAAFHAVRDAFEQSTSELLPATPRVSVVVCSYNGGRTLEQCLRSLRALDYPDYEVILVDDGSTDRTPEIVARFPEVRAIRQQNLGLSVARNVGLQAANGTIIAYTDSDCFVDSDWLTHLVYQLERSGAAAVGGPNLTPEDGWLAACVASSPGQPTHVLKSDQVAEHIPGCNMAYRREALEAIRGFDPQYRKAGDDVDVCWRLQHEGYWITFAPAAFVWHHRRQSPGTYLRQQAGYGEAEALLHFKHPDRFNRWGRGKWGGVLYGAAQPGLRLGSPIIYRGTFGTGLFQCLYQPGPAHWALVPSTLEWHLAAALVGLAALFWPPALSIAVVMIGLTILVAALQAMQTRVAPRHEGLSSRAVIAVLCYTQPLVRSWARYRTRLFSRRAPQADPNFSAVSPRRLSWAGRGEVAYWGEDGQDRIQLLEQVATYMTVHRWGKSLDSGWLGWDLEVFCQSCLRLMVTTAEEEHGGGRRLVRVRYRLTPNATAWVSVVATLAGTVGVAGFAPSLAVALGATAATVLLCAWALGRRAAAHVLTLFETTAQRLLMMDCSPATGAITREAVPKKDVAPEMPVPTASPEQELSLVSRLRSTVGQVEAGYHGELGPAVIPDHLLGDAPQVAIKSSSRGSSC